MVLQELVLEEVDAGLEVQHGVAGVQVHGRRDHVQGGDAVARAERRGAELDLDVLGLLDGAQVAIVGVVVQVVELADSRVPDTASTMTNTSGSASMMSCKLTQYQLPRTVSKRVGQPGPG